MRRLLLIAVLTFVVGTACGALWPPVWPIPQSYTNGNDTVVVDSTIFQLSTTCRQSPDLNDAFERFLGNAFPHKSKSPGGGALSNIALCLENENTPLQLYIPEDYTLSVNLTGIFITCPAVYGCYHALETLSQLVHFSFDTMTYTIQASPWTITDFPRFPHRGLLIDTSRHFLPIRTIQHILQSMTYAKLNTLHWHIVDAIAFPFDSSIYPSLSQKGAYSPQERFTPADIATVVEYARKRGVRVMIELDTPGHTGSMCFGIQGICPQPLCTSPNINNWALDITQNLTYEVIGGLFTELTSLFPEQMVHIGGDEVVTDCWAAHPYIMQWLADRGLTLDGGFEYYVKRVQSMVKGLNRTVVGWQELWEHFGTELDPKTVIHQWLSHSTALPLNVTSKGYRLIWSDSSVWYLDHLSVTWEQMYAAEPCNGLPESNCALILGGEGCQWGETVDTSDAEQTIWPRLAAIAERLWSPRNYTNATLAQSRFVRFRCLLNQRGVAAAPADNTVARQAPLQPDSCYDEPMPTPPSPPPATCFTFYTGLCPGECLCTMYETCGTPLNHTAAMTKHGACSGQCRQVVHNQCPGPVSCLKDAGPCA